MLASEADLTPEWIRAALAGRFPDPNPQLAGTERIGEGYGLSSTLVRCRFRAPCTPGSVVVKLWPTDGPAGTREVPFYASLAHRLGIRAPACYHAAIDDERHRGVLVLEDLEGAVQGDCLQQLDTGAAATLAREIAALHATWWGRSDLRAMEWLPSLRAVERDLGWLSSRRELFLQRFGDRIEPVIGRLLERVESVQARANERLAAAPESLLHGDLHLDNVLFVGSPARPVLLDWARVARGPAAIDVAELLFSIAPIEHLEEILAVYLGEMILRGIAGCDEVSLRHQLGGALLRKLISATCGVALWQTASDRERDIIETGLRNTLQAVGAWRGVDPELFRF